MHRRGTWSLAIVLLLAATGCKGKMEKLRDSLAAGSAETQAPRCSAQTSLPKCLDDGAAFFADGAKFDGANPDQASASVAALLVVDGHASWLDAPATWLAAARNAPGAGADSLRLAMAAGLEKAAPDLGKKLDAEDDARKLFAAVVANVPGACATYVELAGGADADKLTPELSPDHSPCVQKDLLRVDAPGGAYGFGFWRGAMGAYALLKDALRALDAGETQMKGPSKDALHASLAKVHGAMEKLDVRRVDRPLGNQWLEGTHGRGQTAPAGSGGK